ncbi:uncharacterized protein MICPUCDRAFT_58849 [Micromonas pusilla CCMP1545]|uniref:Biogenesis of lysosome-related organelles complex 1 subunit 1 n=1 Tax=Micromonas pusilla (strain CCMP1545) TaxID=564608 RepID=C1MUL1_MICPC|nr:uncharacterized protein MICPUCDRAFT_58849 [Micromonas pusilla CCMP1545]EEH56348.1 predicted protein [Micromonas pusilla CCMP1545]|eukprot:XP_003059216.1 predicted protein [Micromonas pusilla CCMP1545]
MNDALADAVSGDVHDVFEAQKKIEERSRELREKSVRFASVTGEWTRFLNNFDDALRGIGDFERWVKEVEFDLNNLTGVMKYVEEGAEEERGGADAGDEDGNE